MKVFFELTANIGSRSNIRQQLENSKNKIQHWYPNAQILLTEDKNWFESQFYFEADNLPNDAEAHMKEWMKKIKSVAE